MESTTLDIRELRRARRLSLRELADLAGLAPATMTRLERGLEPVSTANAAKLRAALGLSNAVALVGAQVAGEGYVTSSAEAGSLRARRAQLDPRKRSVFDLFCGVGGFSAGFEATGEFEVSAGVDLLGDRLDTFAANHSKANAYGIDIRQLALDTFDDDNPRPFVIVGGPPCQGFSSLRPFRNIEWADPRNNLAEEFVRVVAGLRPEWIVFENVVGLLTHEKGETFNAIVEAFTSIGYRTDARVLNAANFGLPQRRERLIIVGSLRGKRFRWPEPTHKLSSRSMAGKKPLLIQPAAPLVDTLPDAISVNDAIQDLPAIASGQTATTYQTLVAPTPYGRFIRNGAEVLELHEATAHSPEMLEIIRHAGDNIHALPPGMVTSGFSSCYSRLNGSEPSTTITVNFVHPASNRCIHPYQDRALTPREGARLQGFFDTYDFRGSRSQVVKQIGNAVPPLLGKVIAEAVLASD